MDKIKINVNIGEKVYPLVIEPADEEAVRRAAKLINEKMKEYSEGYFVKDKTDLLTMTALFFATEALSSAGSLNMEFSKFMERLTKIEESLDKVKDIVEP
jgi:cell division protein ZapA